MSPRSPPASRQGLAERRLGGDGRRQYHLSVASGCPGNLAYMQPGQGQPFSANGHFDAPGPAVEDHGRAVTASSEAAARYRQAQRAVDRHQAAAALHLAVEADPAFESPSPTSTPSRGPRLNVQVTDR